MLGLIFSLSLSLSSLLDLVVVADEEYPLHLIFPSFEINGIVFLDPLQSHDLSEVREHGISEVDV